MLQNQIRGIMAECGVISGQGISALRKRLAEVLDEEAASLPSIIKGLIKELNEELLNLVGRIKEITAQLKARSQNEESCQRLESIPGIGPVTATALVASVGDAKQFKNGRGLAAFCGLVPRQSSSGGKERLLGISKRGNRYIRAMLVHGARAVVNASAGKEDGYSVWIQVLIERRGFNRAVVAVANKNARIAWALLSRGENYKATDCAPQQNEERLATVA
jgi:transposase